jgi:hypothetical protein
MYKVMLDVESTETEPINYPCPKKNTPKNYPNNGYDIKTVMKTKKRNI